MAYLVCHLQLLQTKKKQVVLKLMLLLCLPRLDGEVLVTSLTSDFWLNCVLTPAF